MDVLILLFIKKTEHIGLNRLRVKCKKAYQFNYTAKTI